MNKPIENRIENQNLWKLDLQKMTFNVSILVTQRESIFVLNLMVDCWVFL